MFNKLIVLASISLTLVACGGGDGSTETAFAPTKAVSGAAGKAGATTSGATSTGNAGQGPVYVCQPGKTSACTCTNGAMGAQSCLKDGSGYDVCVCDGGNAGVGNAAGSGNAGNAADAGTGNAGSGNTGNTAGTGNAGSGNAGTGNVGVAGAAGSPVAGTGNVPVTPDPRNIGTNCQELVLNLRAMWPADFQYICSNNGIFDFWAAAYSNQQLSGCLAKYATNLADALGNQGTPLWKDSNGVPVLTKCISATGTNPTCNWDESRKLSFCR